MDLIPNEPVKPKKAHNMLTWTEIKGDEVLVLSKEKMLPKYLAQVFSFFMTVKDKYQTEANLWLCIDLDDKDSMLQFKEGNLSKVEFLIIAPSLESVSGASVTRHQFTDYCPKCLISMRDKCEVCGSTESRQMNWCVNIHSHGTMSAHWSVQDNISHIPEPGFYMVVGNINSGVTTLSSFTFNSKRYAVKTDGLFEIPGKTEKHECENKWIEYYDSKVISISYSGAHYSRNSYDSTSRFKNSVFNLDISTRSIPESSIKILSSVLKGSWSAYYTEEDACTE